MKVSHSNVGLSKKAIIAQVIKEMPAEIDFTEREIDQLYNLGIEWRNNSLSQEELITKISNLRGGSFIDVVAAIGLIGAMIIKRLGFSISTQSKWDYSTSSPMVIWESAAWKLFRIW
jgi:hypothetical protein